MPIRWTIAIVGALALALLTLGVQLPWPGRKAEAVAAAGAKCPVDAKPANLNFTLKDMNGKDVTLSQYKGKVILLNFWATWCGPCKLEIPVFSSLQEKYGKDGLQVLGLSVDDPLDKLIPYVKEFKMSYPVLQGLGHDDVQDAFGPILGIPVTFVISRDGKICRRHIGLPASKSPKDPLEKAIRETFEQEIKALL
jgi:thiol-disulfide isomerase/thioredoxin